MISSSNQTESIEIILLGFDSTLGLKKLLFLLFFILYIMTLSGNFLIIALYLGSQRLHSPMYLFLSHLSVTDILLSTNVVPNLLCALLRKGTVMTISGCISQFFACSVFTGTECFLLTAMSYDRHLAICNSLRYVSIMSTKHCLDLVICSWIINIALCFIYFIPIFLLDFCDCKIFDYIYCDLAPLLEASCSDVSFAEIMTIVLCIPIVVFPFLFIVLTYLSIFLNILKISTITGRQKAFSTCSSHLTVVCIYYGVIILKYLAPSKGHIVNMNKVFSVLYTVVTPLLNPITYSLRNQDIRIALGKWIPRKMSG